MSLDIRNFYYLTKNSFTFFITKKKKLQNKQLETNLKRKIKHVTDTTSCKIKYLSAYLLQSIVIKFILSQKIASNENFIKRKFVLFVRSYRSRTFAHSYADILYCLSPRGIQPRGSNFLFSRSQS